MLKEHLAVIVLTVSLHQSFAGIESICPYGTISIMAYVGTGNPHDDELKVFENIKYEVDCFIV